MKSIIEWVVALAVPLLFLGAVSKCVDFFSLGDRVQLGSPEYAEYIRQQITDCVKESLQDDLKKSREELPVLPTLAQRRAICRYVVTDIDRAFPGARPRKQDSN